MRDRARERESPGSASKRRSESARRAGEICSRTKTGSPSSGIETAFGAGLDAPELLDEEEEGAGEEAAEGSGAGGGGAAGSDTGRPSIKG